METSKPLSLPPGFGFHPTDAELISHYLKRKILGYKIEFDVIPEIDIYKYEPWDLPAKSLITTRDSKWHFFTSRDKKYPNGSRANRATAAGYWKSTGKDRNIRLNNRIIGTKKTLVFHEGRPPHGKRSVWIMHEYYLNEDQYSKQSVKETFVLCRVTKRNGSTEEEEELLFPQEGKNISQRHSFSKKNRAKKLEDIFLGMMPKKEMPSPSEDLVDLESWFEELSDPNSGSELLQSQPINPPKINGNSVAVDKKLCSDDGQDTGFPLWEEFLEVHSDPQEANFGLLFEDSSPANFDSFLDFHLGAGFLPGYDIYTGPSSLVNGPGDGDEVNATRIRLDALKVSPGTVDQTFFLDGDGSGPSSTYEVRAHVIEKPTGGATEKRSLGWLPQLESSKIWTRSGRRARISRRCRDYLRRARGFVKEVRGFRGLLGRSHEAEASLNYLFFLACMVASAIVVAICMLMDALRCLYAYACSCL
ncbi:uncharacterized protein LOC144702956 [Wolffia australiana]